ncbi:MAG: micrococcal nuclease [Burkholderiales bacterium]
MLGEPYLNKFGIHAYTRESWIFFSLGHVYNPAMKSIALALALSLATSSALAYEVIHITDGDTLTLLVDGKPLKIGLANIDAPEKKQAFGERARRSLSRLCSGKKAYFQAQNIDRDGRTVAVVSCGGIEVNRAQVERGMAWVYRKYNNDLPLFAIEARAKEKRKGLWAGKSPTPPWEFRRSIKGRLIGHTHA